MWIHFRAKGGGHPNLPMGLLSFPTPKELDAKNRLPLRKYSRLIGMTNHWQ